MKTLPGRYARRYTAMALRHARRDYYGTKPPHQFTVMNRAARYCGIRAENSLHSVEFDLWCKAKAYLYARSQEAL